MHLNGRHMDINCGASVEDISRDLPAPMKLIDTTTNKQMVTQAEFKFVFLSQKSIKTAAALNSAGRTTVQLYQ